MSNEVPHLRVVGPRETPSPRRPGPAVVLILIYALLFGGALWYWRSKSPWFQKSQTGQAMHAAAAVSGPVKIAGGDGVRRREREIPITRDELLSGERLPESSRALYFERLAIEHCNCGCTRTLSDCLANEPSCKRSPELADRIRETVGTKR